MEYVAIVVIILISAFIKGVTGFGFALVSLPLLMLFGFDAKALIPLLMLCNLFASILIVLQKKEYKLIDKKSRSLIIYGAVFTIFGVAVLNYITNKTLVPILAIFFIIMSIFSMLKHKRIHFYNIGIYRLAGAVCGFLTGCISVSGPPLALFLHQVNVNNKQFREIFAWFSITTATIALVGYYFSDFLTWQTLKLSAISIPLLFIGSYTGKRLNHRLSQSFFEKLILGICIFSSVALLWKI
ncbi:MAG: sulfite exporter TauE/SafE family protein [Flavobacteriaceae bacterium]|nr:sulfite exporter TauE/SafE family protein [Flavobacteriaceae bacterium]